MLCEEENRVLSMVRIRLMHSGKDEGSSFAAWWRMLSLAILSQVVADHPVAQIPWQFIRCPGYQLAPGAV